MLQTTTIKFLLGLKKNNNKPWFETNRKAYESAKADYTVLVDRLIAGIAKFDTPIGELKAKDCLFRINRDVRFSKDKSPYKSNMGASFSGGGKKADEAGYYFHFEPGRSFAGGGIYMPQAPTLAKIRQEIDYNFDVFKKIIDNKTFKKYFPTGLDISDTLSRPPKGYDENNPAIHFLKLKSFFVSTPFADAALSEKNMSKEIIKAFEAMKPLIDFLNHAVE
ncbi:MAG TPA: DUF2461 domain-containing protein [Ferruginibacter sp.]|nr:DUF2461 domain-containing protein [Ferruginibacter sp.]